MNQQQPPQANEGRRGRLRSGCLMFSLVIALAWAGVVAVHAINSWPHIPMDVSAGDPATQAAFRSVVQRHVFGYAIIALAPVMLAMLLARFVCRKQA